MADGSTRNRNADLFTALAQPRQIADLGPIVDRDAFSRPILEDGGDIVEHNIPVRAAGSPIILPPLFEQFREVANQAAEAVDPDNPLLLHVSQKYLAADDVSFDNSFAMHMDFTSLRDILDGKEPVECFFITSDVVGMETKFYNHPVIFTQAEKDALYDCPDRERFYRLLRQRTDPSACTPCKAYHTHQFDPRDPHFVIRALLPVRRTVTITEACKKPDARLGPHIRDKNPALADWITRHAARPADYGL